MSKFTRTSHWAFDGTFLSGLCHAGLYFDTIKANKVDERKGIA